MNVLAVGCHPDDLEIGCFGTLIKCVKAGHKVFAVHVTNGDLGHVQIMPPELGRIRNSEAEKAARLIGAEAITLDIGDMEVYADNQDLLKEMASIIRYAKPNYIITHNPDDYMTDHIETSKLVYNATFAASLPHFEAKGEVCQITPIYYMDTLAGVNFIPTEYVDISEEMELKLQALALHESQVKWMLDHDKIDFLEFVRACNRGRGCQCGVKYAEGFKPSMNYLRMATKRYLP
jgi:LmbE family N-acetylglucosaminyl deacetylase